MVKDNVKFNCASQTTLLLYHPELPSTRSPGPQSVVRRCQLLVLASELLSQGPGLLLQGEHLGISLKDLGLKGIDCRVLLRLKLDQLDRVEKVKLHMCLLPLLGAPATQPRRLPQLLTTSVASRKRSLSVKVSQIRVAGDKSLSHGIHCVAKRSSAGGRIL